MKISERGFYLRRVGIFMLVKFSLPSLSTIRSISTMLLCIGSLVSPLGRRCRQSTLGSAINSLHRGFANDTDTQGNKGSRGRGCVYLCSAKFEPSIKDEISKIEPILVATKIGYVKGGLEAVKKRKAALQTGNPSKLDFKAYPCKHAFQVEGYLHERFKRKRVLGEWFLLNDEDTDMIHKEMKNYDRSGELMGSKPNFCLLDSSSSTRNVTKSMSKSPPGEKKWEKVKSILEEHRRLLLDDSTEAERSYLENDELEILLDALERHPESDEKIGCGVSAVYVAATSFPYNKRGGYSYCFHVKRMDGSEEDFSYRACFGLSRGRAHYTHLYNKEQSSDGD